MKKSSSETLHTASIGKRKKKIRLPRSSTEHWLSPDPDSMFSTSLLSATEAASPAHLLPFRSKSSLPEEKRIMKKNKRSSISLTSFPENWEEEQQIPGSEVPGAVIHGNRGTSMSAVRRMESVVRRLFARSSGNESLSPQEAQQEKRSVDDGEERSGTHRPRPRHFVPSSVPLHGRRQSLSSEGNEDREDEGMISGEERRAGGKYYSSPSLSSSPRKLSYSFDDIDRLIQMTPQRRKIEKDKKSSGSRNRRRDDAEQDWEERMELLLHQSSNDCPSDASDKLLNQDYSLPPKARTRAGRLNNMKKCNSNFEMGSFCQSTAYRKRIRRSGLFCEKVFAFREEDEQSEPLSGQMHQTDPDCGQQATAMRRMQENEGKAGYQDQGTGDQARDKSPPSSAPHHPHTICSPSLPGSVHHHMPSVQPSDRPQLSLSTGERSSTTSSDSESVLSNSLRFCRLCLEELPESEFHRIASCGCRFCHYCLSLYLTIRIRENLSVTSLSCPDACCPVAEHAINNLIAGNNAIKNKKNLKFRLIRGFSFLRKSKSILLHEEAKGKSHQVERVPNPIAKNEIEKLVDARTFQLYLKLLLEAEIESDPCRTFCPTADCDNICLIARPSSAVMSVSSTISSLSSVSPSAATTVLMNAKRLQRSASKAAILPAIYCCKCDKRFCFSCRQDYHPGLPCSSTSSDDDEQLLHLITGGSGEDDMTDIKRCPRCSVWIERDEGCAQMMCRKCRHVFCWFCLQSLEDDFLLRHYDRGPCKNKLGHSRASVVWHRTQVVGIFAGFGVLLLLISPLFLLAAPCLLCCNCFSCSTCSQSPDLLTPSSSFSSTSLERKDRNLLHFED